MIIVKDDDTLEQAVQLAQQESVRYSDRYQFRTISSPETLRTLCNEAFGRSEIALVASLDEELPDYKATWRAYKAERREQKKQEDKEMRQWIREHPTEIKEMMRRMRH